MATIGNTPQERLVFRIEARKSWSLGILLKASTGAAIDVTDAVISLVVSKKNPEGPVIPPEPPEEEGGDEELPPAEPGFAPPVIDMEAIPVTAVGGHVRFHLQAEDTDLASGEYETAITMRSGGYSLVLAKGVTEILPNSETASVDHTYVGSPEDAGLLELWLRRRNVIKIVAPPVFTKGNQGDKGDKGDKGDTGPGIPKKGATKSILVKKSPADYDTAWAAPESAIQIPATIGGTYPVDDYTVIEFTPLEDIGLKATGATDAMVPRAMDGELWGWEHLSAEDITDTDAKVMMTFEERNKLAGINSDLLTSSDWEATEEQPGYIYNKPELGTASEHAHEDYRPSDWTPSLLELSDVASGYELPEEGPPGTFFILLPEPEEE